MLSESHVLRRCQYRLFQQVQCLSTITCKTNTSDACGLPRRDDLKLFNFQQLAAVGIHYNCERPSLSRTMENVETAIAALHLYILKRIVFHSRLGPFAGYKAAPRQVGFRIQGRSFDAAAFLPLIDVAYTLPHSFIFRVGQPRLHQTIGCYYSGEECQTPCDTQRRLHQQFAMVLLKNTLLASVSRYQHLQPNETLSLRERCVSIWCRRALLMKLVCLIYSGWTR